MNNANWAMGLLGYTPDFKITDNYGNINQFVIKQQSGNVGLDTANPAERLALGGGNIKRGYEVVTAYGANSTSVASVTCPAGKRVIGRGCVSGSSRVGMTLKGSYPTKIPSYGWSCAWDKSFIAGEYHAAVAICANIR